MYCPKCGTYNEDSYCFCLSCGTRVKEQSLGTFDKKTSDGRYIIDAGGWKEAPVAESPTVGIPIRSEVSHQVKTPKRALNKQRRIQGDRPRSYPRSTGRRRRRPSPGARQVGLVRKSKILR